MNNVEVSQDLINNLIILAVTLFLTIVIWRTASRIIRNGHDVGVVFGRFLLNQNSFLNKIIILILLIIEAGLVAFYHNTLNRPEAYQEGYEIPEIVRYGGHFLFAVVSFLSAYQFAFLWRDFFKGLPGIGFIISYIGSGKVEKMKLKREYQKKDKPSGMKMVTMLLEAIYHTILALALPLANIYILALAGQQTTHIKIFLGKLFGFLTPEEIAKIPVAVLGPVTDPNFSGTGKIIDGVAYLPPNYDVYADMVFPIQMIMVTSAVHYFITVGQGLHAINHLSNEGSKKETTSDKKPEKKSKPTIDRSSIKLDLKSNPDDPLEEILTFYGYSGSDLQKKIDDSIDHILDMKELALNQLTSNMTKVLYAIRKFQDENGDMDSKEAKDLKTEIHDFFVARRRTGKGLDITLSRSVGGIK